MQKRITQVLRKNCTTKQPHCCYSAKTNYSPQQQLYPTHQPLSFMQRAFVGAGSCFMALYNPWRGDMVAAAGETLPGTHAALRILRNKMKQSNSGKQILAERPRIHEDQLAKELVSCAPNTLGYAYAQYMQQHQFKASERTPVRFIDDDEELAYVMQRYREIHDFVHALSGMQPSVLDELAVKWFEFTQTKLPMTLLGGMVAPLRLSMQNKRILFTELVPWAIRCGTNSELLMNVYFEQHLHEDIDQLRLRLRFEKAPQVKM